MKKPFSIERRLTATSPNAPQWFFENCFSGEWRWMSSFPTKKRRNEVLADHIRKEEQHRNPCGLELEERKRSEYYWGCCYEDFSLHLTAEYRAGKK